MKIGEGDNIERYKDKKLFKKIRKAFPEEFGILARSTVRAVFSLCGFQSLYRYLIDDFVIDYAKL